MLSLILASGLFLAIHIFISGTGLRGRLIDAIGELPYRGLFALSSLGAIVWMSMAYGASPDVALWDIGAAARPVTGVLVLLALLLAVPGLTTPNPTLAGQENVLGRGEDAVRGIVKITRHPFLWGVALWAGGHLLARGDLAAAVFFGAFLVLALLGPFLIDGKRAKADPEAWAGFAAATSRFPFLAIAQGRTKFTLRDLSWWRLLLALVIYGVFIAFAHEWLFGISLLAAA